MAFGKTFERVAPILMADLIKTGLTENQAAGFVGNFGHESGLVSGQQEGWGIGNVIGDINDVIKHDGGIDWAQWTGKTDKNPRRRDFVNFVKSKGLPYPSYKASLAFVLHELATTEKKALAEVKKTKTLKGATQAVQDHYERPGVKATESRVAHAKRALDLYLASLPPPKPIEEVTVATLQRDLAALSARVADLAVQVAKLTNE